VSFTAAKLLYEKRCRFFMGDKKIFNGLHPVPLTPA
jgi:hypothetical protein